MSGEASNPEAIDPHLELTLIDVEKLASAYSEQNRQVNKRWALCAVTALVAINLKGEDPHQAQVLFATTLNGDSIFPLVLIGLAMTNFVYVIAHISAYDASSMFLKYIEENKLSSRFITTTEGLTGSRDSYADYLHATTASNYNRVFPMFKRMKFPGKNFVVGTVKLLIDAVQFSVVPFAIYSVISHFKPDTFLDYFSIVVAILSGGSSLVLLLTSIRHAVGDKFKQS